MATAFVMEWQSKQYLITARHIAKDIVSDTEIEMYYDECWNVLKVRFIGHGPDDQDFTVLACHQKLIDPAFHIIVDRAHQIAYGAELFFFGFPYGMTFNGGEAFLNKPIPFVKRGTFSAMNAGVIYIDGINNKGFSGGPVFYQSTDGAYFTLVSVISSYKNERLPVIQPQNARPVTDGTYINSNSGIIESIQIGKVLDYIEQNPNGYAL